MAPGILCDKRWNDTKEKNMKLGKVKWFGTVDYEHGRRNDYGFLKQFESEEDLFLHRNGICKNSKFLEKNREGTLVVYEIALSNKPNKNMAVNVRLLEELSKGEREALFQQYIEKNIVLKEVPEIYFQKNIKEYFDAMIDYDNGNTYYNRKKAEELFWDRYEQGYFETSLAKAFGEWIWQENVKDKWYFSNKDKMEVLKKIHWEKEVTEDLLFLAKSIKSPFISLDMMIRARPELLFLDEELCKKLTIQDIEGLDFDKLLTNKEKFAFLMKNLNRGCKSHIADVVSTEFVLQSEELIKVLSCKKAETLVSEIDWTNTQEDYLKKYKIFLSYLEADMHKDAAVKIAVFMREQNAAFQTEWWKLFTDSVKIRILIYSSNFAEERKTWFEPLREIYPYEKQEGNKLLMAALKFLLNIYLPIDIEQKRQGHFMEAHKMLMEYITECFSKGLDVTHGLNTLLDKCRWELGYGQTMYFCDARANENAGNVFCPEGKNRPWNNFGKQGRQECPYHDDSDLTKTKYWKTKDYKDQSFMDYLVNIGFTPDLSSIYVSEVQEYPFRISAFVNRLIDMRPHTKCRTCGEHFYPQFKYAVLKRAKLALSKYNCSQWSFEEGKQEHDRDIYLNFCYHCQQVIDSRECKRRDMEEPVINGRPAQWLCMRCGGTELIKPGEECPVCGNREKSLLKLMGFKGERRIVCEACGYDARNFRSEFENGFKSNEEYNVEIQVPY